MSDYATFRLMRDPLERHVSMDGFFARDLVEVLSEPNEQAAAHL